jgi:hypothetical protein
MTGRHEAAVTAAFKLVPVVTAVKNVLAVCAWLELFSWPRRFEVTGFVVLGFVVS